MSKTCYDATLILMVAKRHLIHSTCALKIRCVVLIGGISVVAVIQRAMKHIKKISQHHK